MSETRYIRGSQRIVAAWDSKQPAGEFPTTGYITVRNNREKTVWATGSSETEVASKLNQAVDEYCSQTRGSRGDLIYCYAMGQPQIGEDRIRTFFARFGKNVRWFIPRR